MKTVLWMVVAVAVTLTAAGALVGWQKCALRSQAGIRPSQLCEAQAQFNQDWTRIHAHPLH